MLTFFRKIRKRLLDGGSTSKYIIYAIGEIALVVIGILIALQVNNWNESRKDREKEKQILQSLLDDFKVNIVNLDRSLERIPALIESQRGKLTYTGEKESNFSPQMKRRITLTNYVVSNIVEGTLNSIINTEKLELVRNEELKKKLTAYPAFLKQLRQREELVVDYVVNKQRPLHRKFISLADLLTDDHPDNLKIKELAFQSDFENLLKNKEYFNVTVGIILTNQELLRAVELLKTKSLEIQNLLLAELNQSIDHEYVKDPQRNM